MRLPTVAQRGWAGRPTALKGDSGWLVGQSLYTMALGLVMTGAAARVYGPETFAILAFAIAVTVVLSPLATLGFETIAVHTFVRGEHPDGAILKTTLLVRVVAGATLLSGIAGVAFFLDDSPRDTAVVVAMGMALGLKSGESFLPWFQARSFVPRATVARIAAYSVTFLVRGVVLLAGGSMSVYAFTYVVDAALVWLALWVAHRTTTIDSRERRGRFSGRLAGELLRRSWPLILSGLAVSAYNRMDQIMLTAMLDDRSEVGRYAAAVTLAEAWYFVPMAVIVAKQAGVMRAHGESRHGFERSSQSLFDAAIRAGTVCAALVALGSPALLWLMFGAAFLSATSVLSAVILVAAGVLAIAGSARAPWLIAEKLEKFTLLYLCVGATVNLVLNILLIPAWGIVGAAAATLAAQIVSVVLLPLAIPATRPSVVYIALALNPRRWTSALKSQKSSEV